MSVGSLDELRAFVAVAEAGGFTAAARRLGVSTNAVSLRIQSLEAALGLRLFVRTTRRVAPTDEGRSFHARVAGVLDELDDAAAQLRPHAGGLRGTVRLAVPAALATTPLLARLRALLDRHADLEVHLRVSNTPLSPAAEGLDIALVVGQLAESRFVGRALGRVNWVLAAAPAYLRRHGRPRAPEELAQHRCLRLLSHPPQRQWTLVNRAGRAISVAVAGAFETDDSRALGDATYAGLGIGIRPARECRRGERAGTLARVLPAYRFAPLEVSALLPPGRLRLPHVAACLEALTLAVRELA